MMQPIILGVGERWSPLTNEEQKKNYSRLRYRSIHGQSVTDWGNNRFTPPTHANIGANIHTGREAEI